MSDSGLPDNSVRGLAQTPDGFLWVATLNGLARFDGTRFDIYDKSNTTGIYSNRFAAMVEGKAGDLWLQTEDLNLIHMHNGVFTRLDRTSGIEPDLTSGLASNAQKDVWVLSKGRVYRWDPVAQRFQSEAFNADDLWFYTMRWTSTGFWAARGQEIFYSERGQFHQLH